MSSLSSLGLSGGVSVNGLVTGLDTDKLLEGLLAVQQGKIERLRARQDKINLEQTAFKSLEARLSTFQSSLTQLTRAVNGVFDARQATSSADSLVTAAATSSATPGTYNLKVNSLARAHQVAAQGFDSLTSAITQGTLQISVGGTAKTVTIDATNNTLSGLASAINAAGAGVTATIVNDGRAQPYRLILTASKTGTANAITLTNNLAADNNGARRPEFNATTIGSAVAGTNYTGTATPTSGGTYTGTTNKTFTFTVQGSGDFTVGTDNFSVLVTDSAGNSQTVSFDNTYTAGTLRTVGTEGVQFALGAGTVTAGQSFTIDAYVPTVQAAADASVTLGSGAGAMTVTSASNTLDGVISGVALNLKGADATRDVTLTVSNDIDKAKKAVEGFVESYNAIMSAIDENVRFDAQTNKAGLLLGNRTVTAIQDQLRSLATGAVAGISGGMNRLSALGITTTDTGRLSLNAAKLDDALNGRIAGTSLEDVKRLFSLSGTSTNSSISFIYASARTKADGTTVQVDITQAATRGSFTATNDLAASTVITAANNSFTITVDGQLSGTITLADGTYSRSALAQAIQAQINADATLAGRDVTVGLTGNKLTITSATYGSTSEVKIGTGSALAMLGLAGTESGTGQNVAGNFIVDGRTEAANGQGQLLTGRSTNAATADLQVRVALTTSQVQAGSDATLTLTRGVASQLDAAVNALVEPSTGRLKAVYQGYQDRIDDVQKTITRESQAFEARRTALLRQFVALEQTVSQLRSTGDLINSQVNALRNLGTNR